MVDRENRNIEALRNHRIGGFMAVKIGLIGCGGISREHISAYLKLKGKAEVVATADLVEERAINAARAVGAGAYYTDYRDILKRPDVDAVDICLPHHLHAKVAVEAAEAGKHILCEKPIARSLEEADSMIDAARRYGVKLMIAENWRFLPQVNVAKKVVENGELGSVFLAKSSLISFPRDLVPSGWKLYAEKVGGGVSIDSGIHNVDMVRWVMGEVKAVTAFTNRLVRTEITGEDTGCILFKHVSDAVSVLALTWAARFSADKEYPLKIYGSEGALAWLAWDNRIIVYKDGKRKVIETKPFSESFKAEIEHFVSCIESDKTPLTCGEEARRDLQLVLAAYESAKTGKAVKV
ncbi:gfo/Idh/MocA family oxidoreductase [Candidatus Bathyarchaeota archaeon]|nr:MAG: gfo/Idh/MocA family oxidoreductase [Candidatus Bathyarchaeota archaeon]